MQAFYVVLSKRYSVLSAIVHNSLKAMRLCGFRIDSCFFASN